MPHQEYPPLAKRSPFVRPLTALGNSQPPPEDSQVTVVTAKETSQNRRPWSAQTHSRSEISMVSDKKVVRQHLRKPHLKAKGRRQGVSGTPSKTLQVLQAETPGLKDSSRTSNRAELEVVTMVGAQTSMSSPPYLVKGHPHLSIPSQRSLRTGGTIEEDSEDSETGDVKKRLKQRPSFEAWLQGSPHDSDEYDTDLEEKEELKEQRSGSVKDLASGSNFYKAVCKKYGFVPVSYLCRHLGDRNIRMRHHYLGGRAAKPIAAVFKVNTITETLDLSDNYIESTGAVSLAMMLRENMFITALNLSNNFIETYGCRALCDMLDLNTTLKSLSMAGNRLMDRDAYYFIEPLKNNLSLTCLDLSGNNFGEMAGVHLGTALAQNDGLTEVDLSWNAIRRKGAVAIANALKVNTFMEVLDLGWNGFGEEGTLAMGQALVVNSYLKVLDLTNNRIDAKSAVKLGNGLKKNNCIETLILNLNPLGDLGIEAILKAADVHPCLKLLSVEEMGINAQNLTHIKELEQDKSMIILYGGTGGYQRNTSLQSVLCLFCRFAREHLSDMETAFRAQDKDRSGLLTVDETKMCLRAAGLYLTGRQLDTLLDEIDYVHTGHIKYREIMSGKIFAEYHKRRPSRGFSLQEEAIHLEQSHVSIT